MEIHIKPREKLIIYAAAPGGLVKTFHVSYQEMMERGEDIVDGLTKPEIDALRARKKILAIKLYKARTDCNLKEGKMAVEDWVARNHCCRRWPYCEHMECIEGLDSSQCTFTPKGLHFVWHYPSELTIKQVHMLMSTHGFDHHDHGCYSYVVEKGETRWASN